MLFPECSSYALRRVACVYMTGWARPPLLIWPRLASIICFSTFDYDSYTEPGSFIPSRGKAEAGAHHHHKVGYLKSTESDFLSTVKRILVPRDLKLQLHSEQHLVQVVFNQHDCKRLGEIVGRAQNSLSYRRLTCKPK